MRNSLKKLWRILTTNIDWHRVGVLLLILLVIGAALAFYYRDLWAFIGMVWFALVVILIGLVSIIHEDWNK